MLENSDRIAPRKAAARGSSAQEQITNGMLVFVPQLEVQCYLRGELLPAATVAVVQVAPELAMQPGSIHIGQPAVNGLAVQGVPKFVMRSKPFISELRDTDGAQKLPLAGEFFAQTLSLLRLDVRRGSDIGDRKALPRDARACENVLLSGTQLFELDCDQLLQRLWHAGLNVLDALRD